MAQPVTSVPALRMADEPQHGHVPFPHREAAAGTESSVYRARTGPFGGTGQWSLVVITALELTFVFLLIRFAGYSSRDAVVTAAQTTAVGAVLFYGRNAVIVIGRRLFNSATSGTGAGP